MIYRFHTHGFRRLFVFNSLYQHSTTTAAQVLYPQNHFLVEYLTNSLGLSKDEALSATKKVKLHKTSRNDPNLVVSFFKELGLNRTQIRSIISANPRLLTCNVEKTLRPKVVAIQELGISSSDLIRVLTGYKSVLARGQIRRPIEYLRNLLGSNENVAKVVRKFSPLLDISAAKMIESNVQLLQKHGFSREYISRFMLQNPRCFIQMPERLQEMLCMVENEFGIPRKSKMFYHGVESVSSLSKTTINMKMGVLRSFGLSDLAIYRMFKLSPSIVRTSEDKLRKTWDFFTKDFRYSPDFLSSHPTIFSLSLEKRVIPRYEVMQILKEKNLNKRKLGIYKVLTISESEFVNDFVLPYKNEIPEVVDSYFKIVGRKKR